MKNNIMGLTKLEVDERIKNGLVNYEVKIKSKSIKKIIADNTITIFNILNICLALAVFFVGSYKNTLFLGVVVLNTLIGIIEEVKAKITLERLKILVSNHATVIREGKEYEVDVNQIVLDDIIKYTSGMQILVDSECLDDNLLVNESLVTGESEPIAKNKGDLLLSGSYIISGTGYAKVKNIGSNNYTSKIYETASSIDNNSSIVVEAIKKFIKFISIIIIPIGLILLWSQYHIDHDINNSVINTVAALVGMIPDGLVLLSSTVFVLSALKLAKKNVLVQDLNCIDSLAAIDTFCFDKTGTLTNDDMELKEVICLDKKYDVNEILANYANNSDDNNATMICLKKHYENYDCNYVKNFDIPFNSINKYSAINFKNKGTFVIGAKEVLKDVDTSEYEELYRILVVCHTDSSAKEIKKENLKVIGLVLLNDTIKENAKEIIRKMYKNNIDIKLISGDSMPFLKSVAKRLDFKQVDCIDLSKEENINYDEMVNKYNIFARVKPDQKLNIIKALKKQHRVAMIGDGVNDILALKEADASISFITAKEAARNASKIILLNDDFGNINSIIKEGRKTVNNLCRSASLFINKTIYSTMLALLFVFINTPYPFQPIHLTLNNFVLIGAPSFVLSLLPNNNKVKRNLVSEILKNAIPSALIIFLNVLIVVITSQFYNISEYISVICFFLVTFNGFMLIYKISKPFNIFTASLLIILITIYVCAILFMHDLFEITPLPSRHFFFVIVMFLIDICLFKILNDFLKKKIK